ncbi:ABC transporter substrate-binding protein [Exiguobacterium sp. TNDT2]|uniref:ABC transporter substrate-binding protein n=1 Tax=Exiguobacterium sp. TNDT2 TaxID=2233531 RepID=UPI000DEFCAD7|nr:ABC transporter substrate-binding protein [Exiguobacterium sp. TNDT2]
MKKGTVIGLVALLLVTLGGLMWWMQNGQQDTASNVESEDRVTLDFWSFWGSETRRPIIEKMISDFNESQDEIFVKHTFIPFGDIWTKELAAVASKNEDAIPDVVVGDINAIKLRGQKQQVEPLNTLIDTASLKEVMHPEAWDAVQYEDETYAVPFTMDTRLLFYNKKMLEEAGYTEPPQTWDDLTEMSEKITVKQNNTFEQVGFYPLFGVGTDVWLINSDGRNYISKDGDVTIDTPEDREALEWINAFTEKMGRKEIDAFKAEFGEQQANPFLSEKVAMYVDVATFYTQIRDYGQHLDYGVVPLPEREEGSGHYSWSGGFALEIPKGAKHPEEAATFIEYMAGKEAQMYWAEQNFDQVANQDAGQAVADQLEGQEQEVYSVALSAMENTLLTPVPVEVPDLVSLVNPELEQATLGKKTPEEALQAAERKVKAAKEGTQ